MRILLIALIVAANVGLAFFATLPLFVTYAPVPPQSFHCPGCSTPDVERALSQTAEYWIDGFSAQQREQALVACGAAELNIVVGVYALARLSQR